MIDIKKQKYSPEYKDKKFKSKLAFEKWLKKLTTYKISFIDEGQGCLEWFIDKGGEVLHSDLQSSIWNGMIVDLYNLKVGKEIGVIDVENQQTKFYDFKVKQIETEKTYVAN